MIVDNIEQRSAAWHRLRMGKITGSKVADLMGKGRNKDDVFSQTAKSYIFQLAGERLFNEQFLNDDDIFQSYIDQVNVTTKAMQWGIDMEEEAKNLLKKLDIARGWEMADVANCSHDEIKNFAASPDALVYDRKKIISIEVKCPSIAVHTKYMSEIKDGQTLLQVEPKYYWQVMAEMSCSKAEEARFVSYNPWLSKPIHVVLIERDEEAIKQLEERVILANQQIDEIVQKAKNNK